MFQLNNAKLTPINEIKLNLEKDLQKVTEENLDGLFGYKFISSEFSLNNLLSIEKSLEELTIN